MSQLKNDDEEKVNGEHWHWNSRDPECGTQNPAPVGYGFEWIVYQNDLVLFKHWIQQAPKEERLQYCLWSVKTCPEWPGSEKRAPRAVCYLQYKVPVHTGIVRRLVGWNECLPKSLLKTGAETRDWIFSRKNEIESPQECGTWIPNAWNINEIQRNEPKERMSVLPAKVVHQRPLKQEDLDAWTWTPQHWRMRRNPRNAARRNRGSTSATLKTVRYAMK